MIAIEQAKAIVNALDPTKVVILSDSKRLESLHHRC